MLPVAADTQPDELPLLHIHVLLRELVAGRAELRDGHFTAIQLVLLDDRRLDGHTVVVPAGNIGDAVALHGLGFVDEILENLVERRSHMDIAVGEGGAVMQLKGRLSGGVLQHEPVQSDLLPVGKCLRLARRQVCPHGKFCCGQVQGVGKIGSHRISGTPLLFENCYGNHMKTSCQKRESGFIR